MERQRSLGDRPVWSSSEVETGGSETWTRRSGLLNER